MKTYIEPQEVNRLEGATTNLRDRLLVRILFRLGCRISEALSMQVEDIDFAKGVVTIQHLKLRIKLACPQCGVPLGKNNIFCPKCGTKVKEALSGEKESRRVRTLPLDRDTLQMVKDYIKRGGPVNRGGKRLLFGINRHRGWQIIKECADKAGIAKLVNPESGKLHNVSPHRLRDAFSVLAVKLDGTADGLRLLQEHLGHQSISTTMRYRKISGKEHRNWYNKLWRRDISK